MTLLPNKNTDVDYWKGIALTHQTNAFKYKEALEKIEELSKGKYQDYAKEINELVREVLK